MSDMQKEGQILMALGELKGQVAAVHSLLASHTERMNRQDERADRHEEKIEELGRELQAVKESGANRVTKIELRLAAWGGGLAVFIFLLDRVLRHWDLLAK